MIRRLGHLLMPVFIFLYVVVAVAFISVLIDTSWKAANDYNSSGERLRSYYVAIDAIAPGEEILDENMAHRYGYVGAAQAIDHKSRIVGRYAKARINAEQILSRELVTVNKRISAHENSVSVNLSLTANQAVGIGVGDEIALVRLKTTTNEEGVVASELKCLPKHYCALEPGIEDVPGGFLVLHRSEIASDPPSVTLTLVLDGDQRALGSQILGYDWKAMLVGHH